MLIDYPPLWAKAWGEDIYGLWADITINNETQRMRWILPSDEVEFKVERQDAWCNQEMTSAGFWLADTPCTQAFWQVVTGGNPSYYKVGDDALNRPVENVSWHVVLRDFVRRFAQTPEWGTGENLCLPTESEWEYAARAGSNMAYWWGDVWDNQRGNANVDGGRRWGDADGTTSVKHYPPNPWGLHDMHGNVWEWCSDTWHGDEKMHVIRGGSWLYHPTFARASSRDRRRRWAEYPYLRSVKRTVYLRFS